MAGERNTINNTINEIQNDKVRIANALIDKFGIYPNNFYTSTSQLDVAHLKSLRNWEVALNAWDSPYLTEVSWGDVQNKPDCFEPCAHTHQIDQIKVGEITGPDPNFEFVTGLDPNQYYSDWASWSSNVELTEEGYKIYLNEEDITRVVLKFLGKILDLDWDALYNNGNNRDWITDFTFFNDVEFIISKVKVNGDEATSGFNLSISGSNAEKIYNINGLELRYGLYGQWFESVSRKTCPFEYIVISGIKVNGQTYSANSQGTLAEYIQTLEEHVVLKSDVSGGGSTWESSLIVDGHTLTIPSKPTYTKSDVGLGNVSNTAQVTDLALYTGNSTAKNNTKSLTNGNVYLKINKTVSGTESEDSKVKISGAGSTTVTTDASGNIVVTGGTIPTSFYWANVLTTTTAAYNKEPEVKSITIGNGTTAAATSGNKCKLIYDDVNKCLKFVFE